MHFDMSIFRMSLSRCNPIVSQEASVLFSSAFTSVFTKALALYCVILEMGIFDYGCHSQCLNLYGMNKNI
jgi:hypothetical protein